MPNTKSAAKALRSSTRKRIFNLRSKRKYKRALKAVRQALLNKQFDQARQLLATAYRYLDLAAKKHVIHPNKAARLKSRLTKALNRQAAAAN